ncbi:MAG: hypothetical protein Q6J74_02015 [Gloeomargarita sp. DG02_1_bins_92]
MKVIHFDGEQLVLELQSGNLVRRWITFVLLLLTLMGVGGGVIAQTRSIRCQRLEPQSGDCQIIDAFFWGAVKRIKIVNNVTKTTIKEDIGYSDASQYPIYQVVLVKGNGQHIPLTNWERNQSDTNRIQNSVEAFLRSNQETYDFTLNPWRYFWGALFCILLILITTLLCIGIPYRVITILNQRTNEALLIAYHFPRGLRLQEATDLNSIYLRFEQGKDSDGDDYYFITLTFKPPEMSTAKYTMIGSDLWGKFRLKSGKSLQKGAEYWQFDPGINLLKQLVRTEVITNE